MVPESMPTFANPDRELSHVLKHEDVIERRRRGQSTNEIAKQLGLDAREVHRIVESAAKAVKARHAGLVDEMFMLHQERLEQLYAVVQKNIDDMIIFNADVFRAAIVILDRQAKLLGLDRTKEQTHARDKYAWLDEASDEQLIERARQLGIRVPEKFTVPA